MVKPLQLELDRSAKTPLAEQIRRGIGAAIESGVLAPGARLPSWQDLAAQLGVARGTVRSAYEKLSSAQLIVASRATGTRVADRPAFTPRQEAAPHPGSFMEMYQELTAGPAVFQMGVPAHETFPAKLFSRMRTRAVRAETSAPAIYRDPRGELELRRDIAAYLALARGIEVHRRRSSSPAASAAASDWHCGFSASSRRRSGWRTRASPSQGTALSLQGCRSGRSQLMQTALTSVTA